MLKNKKIIIGIIIVILLLIITNYLIYQSKTLSLISDNEIYLNLGDKWEDPGYNSNSTNVKVINNIDLSKEGIYDVKYSLRVGLFQKKLVRKIHVLNEKEQTDFIFQLKGSALYYLMKDKTYIEPGYYAFDKKDGDITNQVIIENSALSQSEGSYDIYYKIKNSQGIIKELKRSVIIYSFSFNSSLLFDKPSVSNEIIINIDEENYQYTLLPNKEKTDNRFIQYKVEENGIYSFKFYDKNNMVFTYDSLITNIDKEKPTGTCQYFLYDKSGKIEVNAQDNMKIKGYIYKYGKNTTNLIEENMFNVNTLDDKASVIIYDEADNIQEINCTVTDNSTKYARSYTLETMTNNNRKTQYWFYKPQNNTARKKMPLLVFFHGDGGRISTKNINKYSFPRFVNEGMDFPFYMIAPYCNNEADFSGDRKMADVIHIIEYLISNYNIDPDRIIISGGSSGARGAYTIAATYRNTFSCVVIGSGIIYGLNKVEKDLTYIPMWIFHGIDDSVISIKSVENHVNIINGMGGNVKFSRIQGGHGITETVFKDPELIDWMVSQRKNSSVN